MLLSLVHAILMFIPICYKNNVGECGNKIKLMQICYSRYTILFICFKVVSNISPKLFLHMLKVKPVSFIWINFQN